MQLIDIPHTARASRVLTVVMTITECSRGPLLSILFTSTVCTLAGTALAILRASYVFLQAMHTEKHVTVFAWKNKRITLVCCPDNDSNKTSQECEKTHVM